MQKRPKYKGVASSLSPSEFFLQYSNMSEPKIKCNILTPPIQKMANMTGIDSSKVSSDS